MLKAGSKYLFLLGTDRDRESLEQARENLERYGYSERVVLGHASYHNLPRVLKEAGWEGLDGVLLDLGLSSMQIQDSERGFSYIWEGRLDMRYNPGTGGENAEQLLNRASFQRLRYIIRNYGEEPQATRIAKCIVNQRAHCPILTTRDLVEVINRVYSQRQGFRSHPATRTFQALRIAVNSELEILQDFLRKLPKFLNPGGRVAIVSYHSLEDRIVKESFNKARKNLDWELLTKKPIVPSESEIKQNPRSRSAKLRAVQVPKD